MAVYVGDRYLNSQDSDFVNLVSSDLQMFLDSVEEKADQVLLFPPVSSYHRFLIHKTVEDFPMLCSFSVGEGDDRRSVVCLQELVLRKILSADSEGAKQNLITDETTKEEENQSPVVEGCNADSRCSSSVNMSSQKLVDNDSHVENVEGGLVPNLESLSSHTKDNLPDIMETSPSVSQADADSTCGNRPETDTKDENHSTARCSVEQSGTEEREEQKCSNTAVDAVASASVCDSDRTEAFSEAELEQTDSLTRSDCTSSDIGRDSLQSGHPDLYLHRGSNDKISTESACDSGPSLSAALMNELSMAVGVVHVTRPAVDYRSYLFQEADSHSEEDYGRLIEIYDFPEGMITRDLLVIFKEFRDKHFDIKWVDKTHAIGIFSNQEIAEHVIATFDHPLVKVCPLHRASTQTKQTARKSRDILEPYKPRPETTASTARNLVHGALGLQRPSSKEHMKEHKRRSHKSDDHKHSSRKSKRRVWDGKLRPCAMDME